MPILRTVAKTLGLYESMLSVHNKIVAQKQCFATRFLLPLLTHSSLARRVHYGLFSSAFQSRMKLFAQSRLDYLRRQQNSTNATLLRRNIHRIEKGLMMENRKEVFALDYIAQTAELFSTLCHSDSKTQLSDLLVWSFDVLNEYFNVVAASVPEVERAQSIFRSAGFERPVNAASCVPFKFRPLPDYRPMTEAFRQLAEHRKSVRWFDKDRRPSREQIDNAIRTAILSPSSCNRQAFEFHVFDKPQTVDKLMQTVPGAGGFRTDVPVAILVVADSAVSPSPSDHAVMYIDASLAAMTLIFALQSEGICSCALNWPDTPKLDAVARQLAGFNSTSRPVMLIAAGYPKEETMVACSCRKSLDEIREYID